MRGRRGQEGAPRLAEGCLSFEKSLRCLIPCLSALSPLSPLSAHLARLICPAHVPPHTWRSLVSFRKEFSVVSVLQQKSRSVLQLPVRCAQAEWTSRAEKSGQAAPQAAWASRGQLWLPARGVLCFCGRERAPGALQAEVHGLGGQDSHVRLSQDCLVGMTRQSGCLR